MKTRSSIPLVTHFLFLATALAQGDSNGTYPTVFRADGFNSTEHAVELGTTPVVPMGQVIANDPWSTPLVDGCPKLCSVTGPDPGNWTQVHDEQLLAECEQPLLFTLNIYNQPDRFSTINACALGAGRAEAKRNYIDTIVYKRQENTTSDLNSTRPPSPITPGNSCGAYESPTKAVLSSGPGSVVRSGSDAAAAADFLASYFRNDAGCGNTIVFAKHGSAVLGVYSGADLPSSSATKILADNKGRLAEGTGMLQVCNKDSRFADTFGVVAADGFEEGIAKAQETLKEWASGNCVEIPGSNDDNIEWTVLAAEPEGSPVELTKRSIGSAYQGLTTVVPNEKRAECRAIEVIKDDSCTSLAARCGIRGADFLKFNTRTNLCGSLKEKEFVCCSAGTVPDGKPKPQADGTCFTYTIVDEDDCWKIRDAFRLTEDELFDFNKATWGWSGCDPLQKGQVICLSKGKTPMPVQLADIACGPQKMGTKPPSGDYDGFDLAKLNPCPLKACCSGWGYCGTTAEFCIESESATGAPGSFKKGENGCIQNCGMDIVNNDEPPERFAKLQYFQAYNGNRDCLTMDVTEIEESNQDATHIHFAFAGLTPDFNVKIGESVAEQFEKFVSGDFSFHKVISFGGWAESTEPGTYQLYKDAVKPENRQKFANNVMKFLEEHDLDGVDFDWEYPGATDIPGVPNGGEIEAQNYLRFLTVMKGLLDAGDRKRTLSIALPASFWYLKPFPVDKMAPLLDYFVYMTYDLDGQWDYGNQYANPGCPTGNCLRSHVNRTETYNVLSMVTKAGVPAKKIFVGVSSYGRSFRMADPSCTGPDCLFTGSFGVSEAEPGQCTGTGGYISNAELEEIHAYAVSGMEGFSSRRWYNERHDSDMMVYGTQGNGNTDWVAYMSDMTKDRRRGEYKDLNFGGTTDWAIDLGKWHAGNRKKDPSKKYFSHDEGHMLVCDSAKWPDNLEDLEKNIESVPAHCRGQALTRVLVSQYQDALNQYSEVKKGYDDKFGYYADWVKDAMDIRIDAFMHPANGPGNEYFDCKWETRKVKGEGKCTDMRLDADQANPGPRILKYKLPPRDGFYEKLYEETGIQKEWVEFRNHDEFDGPACNPSQNPGCDMNYFRRENYLRRIKDKGDIEIENPKKIIDEAIPNLSELGTIALGTYFEQRMGIVDADGADIAKSLAMPLFMLQDASESIKEIKKIGEEEKERRTKDLVMMILTIVFAVIPFAGAAASALGGAGRIASAAMVVGEAGNAALTIVEVVDDPTSAPFAILGMLLGAGGIREKGARQAFKDAADARDALGNPGSTKLKKFSDEFQRKDRLVHNIISKCVR